MRVAALVSGGKDSALALHRAIEDGHQVSSLVAIVPRREDSWMFHYPNVHLTRLFSEAAGIPILVEVASGVKENELTDLKRALGSLDVEGVVSGAIESQYQKRRIERICYDLELKPIMPLWKENPLSLLEELAAGGFTTLIIAVSAHGLTQKWLGREINASVIRDLLKLHNHYGISIVGEGGEYETLVLDAPFFSKRIHLMETELIWEKQSGYLLVKRAKLTSK